jgi:hypothetical protein
MTLLSKLIDRTCCLFGYHDFGPWRYHVHDPGGRCQTLWKTRTCYHCPVIDEDFMTAIERIYFVEILKGERECMP